VSLGFETAHAINEHFAKVRDVIASLKGEAIVMHSSVYLASEHSQPIAGDGIRRSADHVEHLAELLRVALIQLTRIDEVRESLIQVAPVVDRGEEKTDPGVRS
jgi:hypothetical protein